MFDNPVIKGPVILVFKRTQGVGDALQRVLNGVGKIIHGEDAPLGALPVMLDITDAIQHRVTHIEIAAGKIDFCPQCVLSFGKLAVFHPLKKIEVFLHWSVPPGAYRGMGHIAPVLLELIRRQSADICKTFFY